MSATPGPWIVTFGEHAGYDCTSAAYNIRPAVVEGAGPRVLATLDVANYLSTGTRDYDLAHAHHAEAQANARLMAAAPELLAELIDLAEFVLHGDFGTRDNEQFIVDARAAIRKATEA